VIISCTNASKAAPVAAQPLPDSKTRRADDAREANTHRPAAIIPATALAVLWIGASVNAASAGMPSTVPSPGQSPNSSTPMSGAAAPSAAVLQFGAPVSGPAVEGPAPVSGPALQPAAALSGSLMQSVALSGTSLASAGASGTLVQQPGLSATVQGAAAPGPGRVPAKPGFTRTATGAGKPPVAPVPYEELHRRAQLVLMPSAYAAHYKGPTGENAEVFLLWYIGTLYDQRGLWIAPISTLFIGADLKWSFLSEKGGRPAAALGYLGGLEIPFTGGVIKVSGLAAQQQTKQAFVHDAYMVLSHRVGPFAVTGGAMYGIKKAFPMILPMLRNPNFTTKANPAPIVPWTAFGGVDLALGERHLKVEVLTLPQVTEDRPWLVNTYLGGILGFDFAYLKDRIGYEVLGYYQLPFYRWPDQKRMEKERDRMTARRR